MSGALTSAVLPAVVHACSIQAPIEIQIGSEELNFRSDCNALWRARKSTLRDLRTGALQFAEVRHLAHSMGEGANNCEKRPDFAFAMLDSSIGSKIEPDAPFSIFWDWAPENLPQTRRKEVQLAQWALHSSWTSFMCSSGYRDYKPRGIAGEEVIAFLRQDHYWQIALDQFGNNPGRDRLLLRELIDPSSKRFDIKRAAALAPKFWDGKDWGGQDPVLTYVAEASINPEFGKPDYEAAAQVLSRFSPFKVGQNHRENSERAANVWRSIQTHRLENAADSSNAEQAYALPTGDPNARLGASLAKKLPIGAKFRFLHAWPSQLEPFKNLERMGENLSIKVPSTYAHRSGVGRVELGLLFKPDGSYDSVHILRSAGERLDRTVTRNVKRYFRPRVRSMVLSGFEGSYVFVPLPSFEYYLDYNWGESSDRKPYFDGDTIRVYMQVTRGS